MSIETEPVPRVPAGDRIVVDDLGYRGDGITHVTARFGYLETPDVPGALAMVDPSATEGQLDLDRAAYFLSSTELRAGDARTMAGGVKAVHRHLAHHRRRRRLLPACPATRTIIMGSHIEVCRCDPAASRPPFLTLTTRITTIR